MDTTIFPKLYRILTSWQPNRSFKISECFMYRFHRELHGGRRMRYCSAQHGLSCAEDFEMILMLTIRVLCCSVRSCRTNPMEYRLVPWSHRQSKGSSPKVVHWRSNRVNSFVREGVDMVKQPGSWWVDKAVPVANSMMQMFPFPNHASSFQNPIYALSETRCVLTMSGESQASTPRRLMQDMSRALAKSLVLKRSRNFL